MSKCLNGKECVFVFRPICFINLFLFLGIVYKSVM